MKIAVSSGIDLTAQDVALRAVPARHVSGRVLSPSGEPLAGIAVKAVPPEEFQMQHFELEAHTAKDGVFEFTLAEGNWRLSAEADVGGAKFYIQRAETVGGRDLERADLRLAPPITLAGKVVRTPPGTPAETKSTGVMLAPREGGYHLSNGMVGADGSFRIENVAPGIYRIQPISPGPPYYLASIEMGGRDVLGQWIEIASGALPIVITYRADGGTVRGTVEECGGATVTLLPREPDLQYAEFVKQARCGANGRYEITGLRPGEYYAWAFDRPVGPLDYASVAGLWAGQAARVTVRAGEATEASMKVTERGR